MGEGDSMSVELFDSCDPPLYYDAFVDVKVWLDCLFVNSCNISAVEEILKLAFKTTDLLYGEEEALHWAEDFKLPEELLQKHLDLFIKCDCNIYKMIKYFKDVISSSRISIESVKSVVSIDNPDYYKMMELVNGMQLFLEPDFVPNGPFSLPKLSQVYKRLAPVVDKILFDDFLNQGLAFVIPKQLVLDCVEYFHLSKLSWTKKTGKVKGRPILNASAGGPPINSEYSKEACDVHWGVIHHPSITILVNMVLEFYESCKLIVGDLHWDDLVLWKLDLRGAYTLLSFEDCAVPFVGAEMVNDNIIFFICGTFGWCGTPSSFQVVSRTLKYEINKLISGKMDIYVDDLFGVSLKRNVYNDVAIATDICTKLFNSSCVESSKTIIGRRVEVIGFVIDLDLKLVSISEKNKLRVIYFLSTIKLEERISIKDLQRYSSWISRYSSICPILLPFIKTLYHSFTGYKDYVSIFINEQTKMVIRLFRTLFILSMLEEEKFTRKLDTFVYHSPQFILEFDASLFGIGFLIYQINPEDESELLLGSSSCTLELFKFGNESKNQNIAEAVAAVVCLTVATYFCPFSSSLVFRGDSISALSWLENSRFKSLNGMKVAMLFVHLCIKHHYFIGESRFISSEENYKADLLSRNPLAADGTLSFDCNPLLELINPNNQLVTDEDIVSYWNLLQPVIELTISSIVIKE